jgi:CubicO group peptidase (beta-lactamase class C family)
MRCLQALIADSIPDSDDGPAARQRISEGLLVAFSGDILDEKRTQTAALVMHERFPGFDLLASDDAENEVGKELGPENSTARTVAALCYERSTWMLLWPHESPGFCRSLPSFVRLRHRNVGLGWRVDTADDGLRYYHHGGTITGGRAFVLVLPEQRVAVAMLTNMLVRFDQAEALAIARRFIPSP